MGKVFSFCKPSAGTGAKEDKDLSVTFPVIDLANHLEGKSSEAECKLIAEMLHKYGMLIVRDPRVAESDNDTFIDNMEKYYEHDLQTKMKDVREQYSYQIGATPEGIEHARNHCAKAKDLPEGHGPVTECPPGVDPKWRYFWRVGETPKETEFKRLNVENVVPESMPEFPGVMNMWGTKIVNTVGTVAEMAALGFGLEKDAFTKKMTNGPHLLAPTGGDLNKYGKKDTVFASYHYDLNFLTIHGRSRFPGLFVWTRDQQRCPVKMPKGCLLLQAGKQFEWLTGGHVLAGFHEVVVSDRTVESIETAKKAGRSLWRVSSTLFAHTASDEVLEPLGHFKDLDTAKNYPPTKAGNQVSDELKAIKLGKH